MIRLVTMLRRKPGLTHDEFLRHWFDVHGPLVRDSSAARYVRRYEQHPAAWPPEHSDDREPEWDGVTIQVFDSVADFRAHLREPDFRATMADTQTFLDTDMLHWILVEEPRVVLGDQ